MIFFIFTSIVFIAELIIAFVIIFQLLKWRKIFKEYNSLLNESKPSIRKIAETVKNISEQFTELAPFWVKNLKKYIINIIVKNLKSGLLTFSLLLLNRKLSKIKE